MTLYKCLKCGKTYNDIENIGGLNAKNAAVGAVLAGPAGAIVGVATGKKKHNNCCPYCGSPLKEDAFLSTMNDAIDILDGVYSPSTGTASSITGHQTTSNLGLSGNYTAEEAANRALRFVKIEEWDRAYACAEAARDLDPYNNTAYLALLLCDMGVTDIERLGLEGTSKGNPNYVKTNQFYQAIMCNNTKLRETLCNVIEQRLEENRRRAHLSFTNEAVLLQTAKEISHSISQSPNNWSICKGQIIPKFGKDGYSSEYGQFAFLLTSGGTIVSNLETAQETLSQNHYVSFSLVNRLNTAKSRSDFKERESRREFDCICLTDRGCIEIYAIKDNDFRQYKELHPNSWANGAGLWMHVVAVSATQNAVIGLRIDGRVNVVANPSPGYGLSKSTLDEIALWRDITCIDSFGREIVALDVFGNIKTTFLREFPAIPQFPSGNPIDIRLIDSVIFAKSRDDCWFYLAPIGEKNELHWIQFVEHTPVLKKISLSGYSHHLLATLNAQGKLTRWLMSAVSFAHGITEDYFPPEFKSWDIDAADVVDIVPNMAAPMLSSDNELYIDSEYSCSEFDYEYVIQSNGKMRPLFLTTPREKGLADLRAFESESDVLNRCKQLTELRKQLPWESEGLCRHCGGEFKGLFKKKCSQCSKKKDYSD